MAVTTSDSGPTITQQEITEPVRATGQVLIEVHAASVNRADLAVLAGTHVSSGADAGPTVVGLDAAGTVLEADPDCDLKVGDRVMTMAGGGLAERVVVDARMPIRLPDSWSFEDGAGAVLALMTAHNAIRTAGRFSPGESVLINAANSGVGQMAIKIARYLGAGQVIAAVRTDKDEALLKEMGADAVVATDDGSFSAAVLEVTSGDGVDVIIDHVGGPYLVENIRSAAVKGRIIGVGRLGGAEGPLDMEALALKRLEIIGVTFRTRDADEKARLVQDMREDLAAGITSGVLKPRIDRALAWTDVLEAQAAVASDSHLGKIILQVTR